MNPSITADEIVGLAITVGNLMTQLKVLEVQNRDLQSQLDFANSKISDYEKRDVNAG